MNAPSSSAEKRWTIIGAHSSFDSNPELCVAGPSLPLADEVEVVERSLLEAAEERAARWREEAWQCYVVSGADPDGADARHLSLGEAVIEVRQLRDDYNEALEAIRATDHMADNAVEHLRAERDREREARTRFVDDMSGQESCCCCGERLTQDVPQRGHTEECSFAVLEALSPSPEPEEKQHGDDWPEGSGPYGF